MLNSSKIVNGFLSETDWRVRENSNAAMSIGSLTKHIAGEVSKDYWLREVYNPKDEEIAQAYISGYFHLHDLGGLTLYCGGYSLKGIINKGVRGIPNIPVSSPAKHLDSILNQLTNLVTQFQNEIMGAVAFSSVDTLLAPFIKRDNLNYKEVKQCLQNFLYSLNSNSRAGAEPAFTNVTLDLTPPRDLIDEKAVIAGVEQDYTYRDCQPEMDLFNRVFCEILLAGDENGNPFAYPIPTYNIHDRFDWDNPNNDLLWEMTGMYGYPYFANFLNSDMQPEDCRSMCCRLRIDMRELTRRNGGLFGSGDSTGSIGVVTINLPRLAYEAKLSKDPKKTFYSSLSHYMDLAKKSLLIKREWLQEHVFDSGLIPAFIEYVGTLDNHFNTIGLLGMNEMCENLLGVPITDTRGQKFSEEVLDFMRERLSDYQEETGQLFNLEATPGESTCYRLARLDKAEYPDIVTQGPDSAPYYTNSCHIPVKDITSIKETFDHQENLQVKFTGGTVIHIMCDGPISSKQAKSIIKTVCTEYKVPYVSISPLISICPDHGHLLRSVPICPTCGKETRMMQRITGYVRDIKNWNLGKKSEFKDRAQLIL